MPTLVNAVAMFKFSGTVDSISHMGGGTTLQLTFSVTADGKSKIFSSRTAALEQGHHHNAMLQLLSQAMVSGRAITVRYTHRAGGVLEPLGLQIEAPAPAKSTPQTSANRDTVAKTPARRTARKR